MRPMRRALQIARFTRKAGALPQAVVVTFDRLYAVTRDQGDIGIFVRLTELALEFSLKDVATLASALEASAKSVPHGCYPLAVKAAWDLGARIYQRLKDPV